MAFTGPPMEMSKRPLSETAKDIKPGLTSYLTPFHERRVTHFEKKNSFTAENKESWRNIQKKKTLFFFPALHEEETHNATQDLFKLMLQATKH